MGMLPSLLYTILIGVSGHAYARVLLKQSIRPTLADDEMLVRNILCRYRNKSDFCHPASHCFSGFDLFSVKIEVSSPAAPAQKENPPRDTLLSKLNSPDGEARGASF